MATSLRQQAKQMVRRGKRGEFWGAYEAVEREGLVLLFEIDPFDGSRELVFYMSGKEAHGEGQVPQGGDAPHGGTGAPGAGEGEQR